MSKVWSYTVVRHPARLALGLSVLEYSVLDIIYKSQTSPRYSTDGWATVSTRKLGEFLGISSSGVGKIYTRMEQAGYLEFAVDRGQKKTTATFYEVAYLEDMEGVHKVDSSQKTGEEVSTKWTAGVHKVDGSVHKVDRKRPQSGHIKKDKVIRKKEREKSARANPSEKNRVNSRTGGTSTPGSAAPPPSWVEVDGVATAMADFYRDSPEGREQWALQCRAVGVGEQEVEPITVTTAWVGKMLAKHNVDAVRNWSWHTRSLQNYIHVQAKSNRNDQRNRKNGKAQQHEHGASEATIVGAANGVLARRKKYS